MIYYLLSFIILSLIVGVVRCVEQPLYEWKDDLPQLRHASYSSLLYEELDGKPRNRDVWQYTYYYLNEPPVADTSKKLDVIRYQAQCKLGPTGLKTESLFIGGVIPADTQTITSIIRAPLVFARNGENLTDTHLGCQPFSNKDEVKGKIVLIQRGNCTFAVKFSNAKAAGAVAIIILNLPNTKFSSSGLYVGIPAPPGGLIERTGETEKLLQALYRGSNVMVSYGPAVSYRTQLDQRSVPVHRVPPLSLISPSGEWAVSFPGVFAYPGPNRYNKVYSFKGFILVIESKRQAVRKAIIGDNDQRLYWDGMFSLEYLGSSDQVWFVDLWVNNGQIFAMITEDDDSSYYTFYNITDMNNPRRLSSIIDGGASLFYNPTIYQHKPSKTIFCVMITEGAASGEPYPSIILYNVTDPSNITTLSTIVQPEVWDYPSDTRYTFPVVGYDGTLISTSSGENGMQFYNISDLQKPVLIGSKFVNSVDSKSPTYMSFPITPVMNGHQLFCPLISIPFSQGTVNHIYCHTMDNQLITPIHSKHILSSSPQPNTTTTSPSIPVTSTTIRNKLLNPSNNSDFFHPIKLAAGYHTCALYKAGVVRCWGNPSYGSLGYGSNEIMARYGPLMACLEFYDPKTDHSVIDLSASVQHSCAVVQNTTSSGPQTSIFCWGSNSMYGELGYREPYDVGGSNTPRTKGPVPLPPADGLCPLRVFTGPYTTCAIFEHCVNDTSAPREKKRVARCWGSSLWGQLGYRKHLIYRDAAAVGNVMFDPKEEPLEFALGAYHSCVLTLTGKVKCWGDDYNGKIGYQTPYSSSSSSSSSLKNVSESEYDISTAPFISFPTETGERVTFICAGFSHTCALMVDGSVYCWGANHYGQLGGGADVIPQLGKPVRVQLSNNNNSTSPGSNDKVKSISCGMQHTCALFSDDAGSFICWGDNSLDQLGYQIKSNNQRYPFNSNPSEYRDEIKNQLKSERIQVKSITAGSYHTCVIVLDEGMTDVQQVPRLRCWGESLYTYSNTYTAIPRRKNITSVACTGPYCRGVVPSQSPDIFVEERVTAISAYFHVCVIITPGKVKCWGDGSFGRGGDGLGRSYGNLKPASAAPFLPVQTGHPVKKITAGMVHTCVLDIFGFIQCWQPDQSLLQGVQTILDPDLVYTNAIPDDLTISNINSNNHITPVIDIASSSRSSVILFNNGSFLFITNEEVRFTTSIQGDDRLVQVTAGWRFGCGITSSGYQVYCWGLNLHGTLGLGHQRYMMVVGNQTSLITEPVSLGAMTKNNNKVVKVSAGQTHACCLFQSGDVACWGGGEYGQTGYGTPELIGDDETIESVGFVDLGEGERATDLSCSFFQCCVILQRKSTSSNSRIKCWGRVDVDDSPSNTNNPFIRPADVLPIEFEEEILIVESTDHHTCVVTIDGQIKCWGNGRRGELGYGNTEVQTNASRAFLMSLSCGDGVQNSIEECDDGNFNSNDGCSPFCTVEQDWGCRPSIGSPTFCFKCGNYFLEEKEDCDDGNNNINDGCSNDCKVEIGWRCTLTHNSKCNAIPGDGMVLEKGGEQCDDGNLNDYDGCSGSMKKEPGWSCIGQPSVCQTTCGDNIRAGNEDCDDGNRNDGDGCSSRCTTEDGWSCGLVCTGSSCRTTCSRSGDSNTKLIIGLVVGLTCLLCLALIIFFFIIRRRQSVVMIAERDLVFEKNIGEGSFGEVWIAKWRGTTTVAVKKMKKSTTNTDKNKSHNQKEYDLFLQEANVMHQLPPHPHIVQFLGICNTNDALFIVTEYVEKGSIKDYFKKHPELQHRENLELCVGITAGMDHLHSRDILHRDLACRNVLIELKQSHTRMAIVPKISDFGLSKANGKHLKLPIRWTAPEVFGNPQNATKGADVWSFGVVMYEIFTHGGMPYPQYTSNKEVISFVTQGGRLELSHSDSEVANIMSHCWEFKPILRPSFAVLNELFDKMIEPLKSNNNNNNKNNNSNQTSMDVKEVVIPVSTEMVSFTDHLYENDVLVKRDNPDAYLFYQNN